MAGCFRAIVALLSLSVRKTVFFPRQTERIESTDFVDYLFAVSLSASNFSILHNN